jgi:membrane-bound serine protease (ClpP class)
MSGWVQLQGERWQVQSRSPLRLGQQVRVVARTGVMLDVIALDETPSRGG